MQTFLLIISLMSFYTYVCLVGLISGIYVVIIEPLLYHLWIIPKIENRYQIKLVFDNPAYRFVSLSCWGIPPLEVGLYIFCMYVKWERFFNNPYTALKKIKYNIKTASSSEIIMGFITAFFVAYVIIAGAGIIIYESYIS